MRTIVYPLFFGLHYQGICRGICKFNELDDAWWEGFNGVGCFRAPNMHNMPSLRHVGHVQCACRGDHVVMWG